jgi:hypothetical protein
MGFAALAGGAALVAALAGMTSACVSWAQKRARFVLVGVAAGAAFLTWNLLLQVTHAGDLGRGPVGVHWLDAGSGVCAFLLTTAMLTPGARGEPRRRVILVATLTGLVLVLFDLLLL